MTITKKQARVILDAFSHLTSEDCTSAVDLLVIDSILKAYPSLNHHLREFLNGVPEKMLDGEPNEAGFTRREIAELEADV